MIQCQTSNGNLRATPLAKLRIRSGLEKEDGKKREKLEQQMLGNVKLMKPIF